MKAKIRQVFSSDVKNLDEWRPPKASFSVVIRMLIGPNDGRGEESFDLTVCSPSWLEEQVEVTPVFDARNHLVVRDFDWVLIRAYLERRVAACSGDEWEDIARQLSRFAFWEFEDLG